MIRILIERTLLENKVVEYHQLIRQLKQKASHMVGYVSGEILVDPDNSLRCLVISNWENIKSWEIWANSDERKRTEKTIRKMLSGNEKISIYQSDIIKY
ncbi:MAG: quinol monooxygenase YgiN [Enterobacterales bacterium]|jgi:quinol monooxygenase YgiN